MTRQTQEADVEEGDPKEGQPAAEWVLLCSLVPFEGNPRRNDKTIPVVADSIRRFGWGSVIVARREDRQIIAGHARRAAAMQLKDRYAKATTRERSTWHPEAVRTATTGEVPVRWKDLDQHDAALLLVADNRIGESLSETDDERLGALLAELQAAEVDLVSGTGLTDEEVAKLLGDDPGDEEITGTDPGEGRYKEQYGCIVTCTGEADQERVYNELKAAGYQVRVVTT